MTATTTLPRGSAESFLEDPDVQLMLRVSEGDNDGFAELVGRYRQRVLQFFRRELSDHAEAEDLTQEVFLRVYRYRQRYKPRARFATWVFFIARNVVRNALRSKRRSPRLQPNTSPSDQSWRYWAPGDAPCGAMERDELACAVRSAVAGLGGRTQLALELYQFQDRSCAEVAEVLQMTAKGAKSLLFRARQELRDALVGLLA
jgi:RNA polymerase sigma-70 factor (ECF subfamily)